MRQAGFIEAFLPAGFGRDERLERISGLIDWERIGRLVAPVRSGLASGESGARSAPGGMRSGASVPLRAPLSAPPPPA